ncbi:MAG: T9SS type A sorting domain-containing protein [Chitinispirillia bacterium]
MKEIKKQEGEIILQFRKKFLISLLILGCVITLAQPLVAQRRGFLIYSEGADKGRTLYKKNFTVEDNKPVLVDVEQLVCKKGEKGGDIQVVISHDGKWIAFARSTDTKGGGYFGNDDYHAFDAWDIHIARIDGDLPTIPVKVHQGYWPSWGDDSDQPVKTLYFSYHPNKSIYKCRVDENGNVSGIKEHHSGFTDSWDLHMQCSPDGEKVAFREGDSVYILNIETGKKANGGSGCHPSWCANSEWLFHANSQAVRYDGTKHKKGIGGNYHYGSSPNLKWFTTRTGSNNCKDQNVGRRSELFKMNVTDLEITVSDPVVYSDSASWVDVHEVEDEDVITSVRSGSTSQSLFTMSLLKHTPGPALIIHSEANNLTGGIFDMKGQLKRSIKMTGRRTMTIPLHGFIRGIYIVQLNDGKSTIREKINIIR